MNRVDLAMGLADIYYGDERDHEWVARHGRNLRRRARLNRDTFEHRASTAITTRIEGWRKYGEPRGYTFWAWTTMSPEAFRQQLHVAVGRGSNTAAKQLAIGLVEDLQGAA